jgi:hypothetical protein
LASESDLLAFSSRSAVSCIATGREMSCPAGDENNDSCLDLLRLMVPNESRLDSGYLTFTSPCGTSPSRISPSSVILSQLDSPLSDHDVQSPVNAAKRRFLSAIDYEHYISNRKHFDILTQLHHRNTYHLIDTILVHLSAKDLYASSKVSRKWHSILRDYHRRQQSKNVKRNLFNSQKKKKKTMIRTKKFTSTPMQSITNLLEMKQIIPSIVEPTADEDTLPTTPGQQCPSTPAPEQSVHLTASSMSIRYGYLKDLHGPTVPKRCPICAFVSVVDVNDQHG